MADGTRISDHSGHQYESRRAAELAGRQFWAIARRQLLDVGVSKARVRSWIRSGRLHRVLPGVYAWGRRELSVPGLLAARLLYAGPGSALTGVTALWWLELLSRQPHATDIASPARVSSRHGLRISHPAIVERSEVRGLPVVPLPSALLAAAPELSHNTLRLVLARAEFQRLLSLIELEHTLGRGRSGSTKLRDAMDAHLPQLARCANRYERDFVLLCELHGFPIPEPNTRIGRYRPDMLWEGRRLIVEIDGKRAHSTAAQLAGDRRRQADLEQLGYTVVRFPAARIASDPGRVGDGVRKLLG